MSERFVKRGRRTSAAEVTRLSTRGFWLRVDDREHFVGFREFPYFRYATVAEVADVRRPEEEHLRWPRLDVDLELESIEHPERYPLVDRLTLARLRERAGLRSSAAAPRRMTAPRRRRAS